MGIPPCPPSATLHLIYFLLERTLKYFVRNPDSHNTKRHYDKGVKAFLQLRASVRISCLRPDIFLACEATLETLCLRINILFHMLLFFFPLEPRYYELSLLRTLNLPPRVSSMTGVDCSL